MPTNEPRQNFCGGDWIERFLNDQLAAEQVAAFENHLDECAACRRELNACAADESWWSRARVCLAEGDLGPADSADAAPRANEDMRSADAQATLATVKPYLAPTDDPRMMGRVGLYEIVGLIGSGGNGIVLKGFDAALHRYVAIKLLSPRLADSGPARRRFSREAQAAAAVVHENVMAIHAVAETQGLPYLVMPYSRGPSLEKRLRGDGPLSLEEVLRVGMQIAAGLSAAHAQGLVHRDIKPANILLEEGVARVKITDFGLARAADDASLTRSGVIAGTPQYMSPEQARGDPVDQRTDLFSLGSVLFAACTGHSPFRAETSYGVLRRICESEAGSIREINPAVPGWLERLVGRLLAKDPDQRYGTAAEVAALLERCLANVQQPMTAPFPEELADRRRLSLLTFARSVGRRGVIVATLVAAALGTAAIARFAFPPPAVRSRPDEASAVDRKPRAIAPTSIADETIRWQDGIDEKLGALRAETQWLQRECSDDLWNDGIGTGIEKLEVDASTLRKDVDRDSTEPDEAE